MKRSAIGAATVGGDAAELLAVDMGCVGADLECKETQVSICVKDGHGPYDYEMVERLIAACKKKEKSTMRRTSIPITDRMSERRGVRGRTSKAD